MLKAVSILLLLGAIANAADTTDSVAAGFASGNTFQASAIEGNVIMTCEGFNGTSEATYTCRDVVLDPSPYDYFVGPQDVRATQVELKAEHQDGSSRIKMANYDGKTGKSATTFNLWISSLFQKPLLETGTNKVHYSVYDNRVSPMQEYASGDFTVTVKRGNPRRCPTTQYRSTDVNDCNSQYSICQRYFEQFNNCR
ncbi:hypothetical protein [Bdellovibrio sp. NC01]|uniref:hypothetical protein n=1 Tax=Bdellovibrio sp. NC01 TaxID=2220073 RepID=UPI0011580BF5|nr:hypothetical protein [Bdellovibrio sp. NC01]QDK39423.1 hypothetical protein DOE51_18390 [Bdellovibrio sp. NC01]